MKMKLHIAKPEHEVAHQDLINLIRKHADKLTPLELLAIGANMLGKLLALQDQRKITPELAMTIIIENIQYGNQMVIDEMNKITGAKQ